MTHYVCVSYSYFRLLALSGQNLDEFVISRCLTEFVTFKWLTMCVFFILTFVFWRFQGGRLDIKCLIESVTCAWLTMCVFFNSYFRLSALSG